MRIVDRLGDRRLTPYLLIAYATLATLLLAWGVRVPGEVVRGISRLVPFVGLYVLAAVHLACCLLVTWPAIRQRVSLAIPFGDPGSALAVPPEEAARAAREAGLRVRLAGGRLVACRNRWSPLGTTLTHAALLLLPAAFVLSAATRFTGEGWVVEGHAFGGTRAEYTRVEPEDAFSSRAPRVAFQVESIEAEFWGDRLFFTDLRALLAVGEGDVADARWVRLPEPTTIDGARVTIRGFNYTPAFELARADGPVLQSGDLSLRLFPPGTEDSFALPGLPHRAFVRLYPDSAGPSARPINRGMALREPLFHVAVTCGRRLAAHGWLRPGEPLAFDGYALSLPVIRRGGDILVHRDLGYPLLWTALVIGLAGTLARIALPSTRVWVEAGEDGPRGWVREDPFGDGRGEALLRAWTSREG